MLATALILLLGACAAPPAAPVPHDDPIMFGKANAPVQVTIWMGIKGEASKRFIAHELQPLLDGPVKSGAALIRLEPVSNMDGTLPAVCVLWCIQNEVKGDLATKSQSSLLLLQAMQVVTPNGSPGYGRDWWLEAVAAHAGLDPKLVTGCKRNTLAAEAVRKSYLAAKDASLRGTVALPMVAVDGKVVKILDPTTVTAKDIEAAIKKAGS